MIGGHHALTGDSPDPSTPPTTFAKKPRAEYRSEAVVQLFGAVSYAAGAFSRAAG
jgi:hypothetical protein